MYISDIISELDKRIIRIGKQDYYPVDNVRNALNKFANTCIQWDVEDFKGIAIQKTDENVWSQYYNENMFEEALNVMIDKHDASIGITWDTVEYYLDTYCKIKDYVEPLEIKYTRKR